MSSMEIVSRLCASRRTPTLTSSMSALAGDNAANTMSAAAPRVRSQPGERVKIIGAEACVDDPRATLTNEGAYFDRSATIATGKPFSIGDANLVDLEEGRGRRIVSVYSIVAWRTFDRECASPGARDIRLEGNDVPANIVAN